MPPGGSSLLHSSTCFGGPGAQRCLQRGSVQAAARPLSGLTACLSCRRWVFETCWLVSLCCPRATSRAGPGGRGERRRARHAARAKPSTGTKENLTPLELLQRENELLRDTISSADSAIGELEGQLQVGA